MVNKGEIFELLNEADRLVRWWRENRPGWKGPLHFPRTWRGKSVRKILPKHMIIDGKIYHDGIEVKIQGES